MKIRIGDQVKVITGKDKGKSGEVMRIDTAKSRVVVKGVNIITRHIKASANRPGEKVQYEKGINASNVMILCPKTSKPSRVGYRKDAKGKKERFAKLSKETLDHKVKK